MAKGDIIRLEQVENVVLFFENSSQLTFANIAYTPECNSNLISLGQLQETSILYYDYPKYMILKKSGNVISFAIRKKNCFVLDIKPYKAILTKRRGRLTYLLSKNPQIRLWHR